MEDDGILKDIGGRAYLARINKAVATASNVEQYALMVSQKELRRDLIGVGGELINSAYDQSNDILSEVDKAESKIFEIAEKRISKSVVSVKALTRETLQAHGDNQRTCLKRCYWYSFLVLLIWISTLVGFKILI